MKPAELKSAHREFIDTVVYATRSAFPVKGIYGWLEQTAAAVSTPGRRRTHVELGRGVHDWLSIGAKFPEYREYELIFGREWTGSIKLSGPSYNYSVPRVGPNDIRALQAHEIAHLMLSKDEKVWPLLRTRSLVSDSVIERLTDDAARIILLPGDLLDEMLSPLGPDANTLRHWKELPRIADSANVPTRTAATRLAQRLLKGPAVIIHVSIPLADQLDLFGTNRGRKSGPQANRRVATLRWIMRYEWYGAKAHPTEYLFADKVGTKRRVTLSEAELGSTLDFGETAVDPQLIHRLVGNRNWDFIAGFDECRKVAWTIKADTLSIYLLATSASSNGSKW